MTPDELMDEASKCSMDSLMDRTDNIPLTRIIAIEQVRALRDLVEAVNDLRRAQHKSAS